MHKQPTFLIWDNESVQNAQATNYLKFGAMKMYKLPPNLGNWKYKKSPDNKLPDLGKWKCTKKAQTTNYLIWANETESVRNAQISNYLIWVNECVLKAQTTNYLIWASESVQKAQTTNCLRLLALHLSCAEESLHNMMLSTLHFSHVIKYHNVLLSPDTNFISGLKAHQKPIAGYRTCSMLQTNQRRGRKRLTITQRVLKTQNGEPFDSSVSFFCLPLSHKFQTQCDGCEENKSS